MKKILFIISFLFVFIASSFAQIKGNEISMVSYEQRWLDNEGTLALKNNTSEDIRSVTFQITYLDMSGNALDYEEFTRSVNIAPGMTKKVDIPAYEHDRNYHYYKSENSPLGSPAFKVKFELKGYNSAVTEKEDHKLSDAFSSYSLDQKDRDDSDLTNPLITLIFVLFVLGVWAGMYIIVAVMAHNRDRSVVIWVLLSIIASPLLMIIILLIVGKDNRYIDMYE